MDFRGDPPRIGWVGRFVAEKSSPPSDLDRSVWGEGGDFIGRFRPFFNSISIIYKAQHHWAKTHNVINISNRNNKIECNYRMNYDMPHPVTAEKCDFF